MKYDVEMCYGMGITVSGIEAISEEDAISKAKQLIKDELTIIEPRKTDCDLEFEEVLFCQESK